MYENVDYNGLKYEYVGLTEDVSFHKYMDSKELFNKSKDNRFRFDDAKKKQKELPNKLNKVKIGKKIPEQKEMINNLENFYKSREDVLNFFKDYTKMFFDASYKAKQIFQTLPIALAQVKADNNSESLLNEIRQIVYSLYQSKQITKKVYNNIIKSIQLYTMDTIFMNSENSKTSELHVLILKLNLLIN